MTPGSRVGKRQNRRVALSTAAVIAMLGATAFAGRADANGANASRADTSRANASRANASQATTPAPPRTPAPTTSPPLADVVPFGPASSFQWTNGMVASVIWASRFSPSTNSDYLAPADTAVEIVIKVTNGTSEVFAVSDTTVDVKTGTDGTEATSFSDLDKGIALGLDGSIAPGHSATAIYGFAVPTAELSMIDVEVTPDFNYDAAIFEGAAS